MNAFCPICTLLHYSTYICGKMIKITFIDLPFLERLRILFKIELVEQNRLKFFDNFIMLLLLVHRPCQSRVRISHAPCQSLKGIFIINLLKVPLLIHKSSHRKMPIMSRNSYPTWIIRIPDPLIRIF